MCQGNCSCCPRSCVEQEIHKLRNCTVDHLLLLLLLLLLMKSMKGQTTRVPSVLRHLPTRKELPIHAHACAAAGITIAPGNTAEATRGTSRRLSVQINTGCNAALTDHVCTDQQGTMTALDIGRCCPIVSSRPFALLRFLLLLPRIPMLHRIIFQQFGLHIPEHESHRFSSPLLARRVLFPLIRLTITLN